MEEDEDAPSGLIPNACSLFRGDRFGEKEACAGRTAWPDAHPPLAVASRGVFEEFEAELVDIIIDGVIVIENSQCDLSNVLLDCDLL